LNGTIEILVIYSILVVPDSDRGISHFVSHKPDAIVSRVGLKLAP
jgi:hypothetical protein